MIRYLLLFLALISPLAQAQTVPGSATLAWTNPTGVTLTAVEVHWSTSPIADEVACTLPCTGARSAQVTLSGTAQTTSQTIQVSNGQTLYFRVRAVDGTRKSAFSNQASKLIELPLGAPSSLTITIVVSP
jgi:predicted phage tail protein